MCGIFGLVSTKWKSNAEDAAKTISHRGPDDYGVFEEGNIKLIHYRLAIQDISPNGHQPMISEDNRFVIIINGEIYNHNEIREKLKFQNFRSSGDTETVLYAFAEMGTHLFSELNGIFALAILDKEKMELTIARDPFGIKPLYFHDSELGFVFSSELKSIASLNEMDATIDTQALLNYVQFLYSPGHKTPFKAINKLLPGHYIRYSVKSEKLIAIHPFYKLPFIGRYLIKKESFWIDALDLTLTNAVKRQLLSDVPVAYFISGGLDSSLIVAIVRKLFPDKILTGFTMRVNDRTGADGFVDDLPYAIEVARHLNIELHIVDGNIDFTDQFDDMIFHLDEPQADIAPIYVAKISEAARQKGFPVLISGAGGDDVFGGYRRHQSVKLDAILFKLPGYVRKTLYTLSRFIKPRNAKLRRLKKFLMKFQKSNLKAALPLYYEWISKEKAITLFHPNLQNELKLSDQLSVFENGLNNIPNELDPLNQALYFDLQYFLPDHNLNYTDKMSMKYGVEVRVPYLDKDLIELSTKIHPDLKIRNGVSKYLLKKVAERYLPINIIYRSKTGFGAPVREWVTKDISHIVSQTLSEKELKRINIFDYVAVKKLIEDNQKNKLDASYIILSLMAIQTWVKLFVKKQGI